MAMPLIASPDSCHHWQAYLCGRHTARIPLREAAPAPRYTRAHPASRGDPGERVGRGAPDPDLLYVREASLMLSFAERKHINKWRIQFH